MSDYSINWSAILHTAVGDVSPGQGLCKSTDLITYVPATTAALAAVGNIFSGFALSSSQGGTAVQMLYDGEMPASITGLGTGAVSFVGLNSLGVLQRIGSSTGAVGQCFTDGSVKLQGGLGGASGILGIAVQQSGSTIVATATTLNFIGLVVTNVAGVATATYTLPTAAGDWTGAITANTVGRINGAMVPAAGALTTGNSLRVTGASALSYSALDLAGGSGFVTGVLPSANLPTSAGDWTGLITANTVVKINGSSVPAGGALTTGNVLQVTGVGALSYAPINLAGGANFVTGVLPAGNVPTPTISFREEGSVVVAASALNAVGPRVTITNVGGVATLTVTDAVDFDDSTPANRVNIRSFRASNQSVIDNTQVGITNLGSMTIANAGATGAYSTIGGGDRNIATGAGSCVPGGRGATASGADSFACGPSSVASNTSAVAFSGGQATGNGSFAANGCTASGTGAFASGLSGISSGNQTFTYGFECTASGGNSRALGVGALALRNAQQSHANGYYATRGDCQRSVNIIRGTGSGATPVNLGGGASAAEKFALEDSKAYVMRITCMANRTDAAARAMFVHDLLVHCNAGVAVIDNDNLSLSVPNGTAYVFAVSVDGAEDVVVTFTGTAGHTVHAMATIEYAEVAGF